MVHGDKSRGSAARMAAAGSGAAEWDASGAPVAAAGPGVVARLGAVPGLDATIELDVVAGAGVGAELVVTGWSAKAGDMRSAMTRAGTNNLFIRRPSESCDR